MLASLSPEFAAVHRMSKADYRRYLDEHKPERLVLFPRHPALEQLTRTPFFVAPIYWLLVVASVSALWRAPAAALVALGFVLWYLLEYALHRFVFHADDRLPNLLHFVLHGIHHKTPQDSERLVFPPLASTLLGVPVFAVLRALLAAPDAWGVFVGLVVGFQHYELLHYLVHHHPRAPLVRSLVQHHAAHHFTSAPCNYGVSNVYVDRLFRTNKRSAR